MERSRWEPNISSASGEIPLNWHTRASDSTPLIPDLSQIIPIHIPISSLQDMFNIILSTTVCVFKSLPFRHGFNHKPCTYL